MTTLDTLRTRRLTVEPTVDHGWQCWYDTGHGRIRIDKTHRNRGDAQRVMAAALSALFPAPTPAEAPSFDILLDGIDAHIEESLCD